LLKIGGVTAKHSRQPVWESGYDMFWVSSAEAASIGVLLPEGVTGMWVFVFLSCLSTMCPGTDYLYLWNLIGGAKHIQVRFFEL